MYSLGKPKVHHHIFLILFLFLLFQPLSSFSENLSPQDPTGSSAEIDAALATMSDAQVRERLAEVLKKDSVSAIQPGHDPNKIRFGAKVAVWLQSFGIEDENENDMLSKFLEGFRTLPSSAGRVIIKAVPPDCSFSPAILLLILGFIISLSLLLSTLFSRAFTKHYFHLDSTSLPSMGGPARFISGFIRSIPELLSILVFAVSGYLIFFLTLGAAHPPLNLLYNGALLTICIFLFVRYLARLFLSPTLPVFRIIPVSDNSAQIFFNLIHIFTFFIIATIYTVILMRGNSMGYSVANAVKETAATLVTLTSILLVFYYRRPVADYIRSNISETGNTQWAAKVFAKSWHMLAAFYFLFLWSLLLYDYVNSGYRSSKGAFVISFLIIPIWLLVNALGQWVTRNIFNTLGMYKPEMEEKRNFPLSEQELIHQEESQRLFDKARNFTRIAITVVLGIWLARLWNFYIPYVSELTGVFFDTLLILISALFFWKTISSWIERKIFESTADDEEIEDDGDSEWGTAAKRGRAYTLLPMLKKFIGSVLVVMVTLTMLSSFGVDIGPLLAGAGVVGLAVGFGAQKLVSDILSGFFFLLDDAFRVGEYIEAGGLSGSVEDITLRNVMLRHHRGMLQIVPHSELGAVTNYMRGGIIVKFNLDFPYDADIDQIRKVIKKVGQAMMEDEEFGKDFIKPVKSAGVREITNSVMTIRVKFTAQPGTHFVIRREAYKRITEALAAKNIHYAHRKVIVDLPNELIEAAKETGKGNAHQIIQAAGAAALEGSDQDSTTKSEQSPI